MLPGLYANYIYPIISGKVKEFLNESVKAKKCKRKVVDEQLLTEPWGPKHHASNDCLIVENRKLQKTGYYQA
jgi:hypothetical protein